METMGYMAMRTAGSARIEPKPVLGSLIHRVNEFFSLTMDNLGTTVKLHFKAETRSQNRENREISNRRHEPSEPWRFDSLGVVWRGRIMKCRMRLYNIQIRRSDYSISGDKSKKKHKSNAL